jgi:hypothetical protein
MAKNWLFLITPCLIVFLLSANQLEAASVSYAYDELSRLFPVIYDDGTIVTYTYDKVGNRLVKDLTLLQEGVSPPSKPIGPTSGTAEVLYSYSVAGSSSNLGHPVQYLFDWGDGTNSGWLPAGQTNATKSWPVSGTYEVTVQARCASHNFILSPWSESLSVDIVPIQIELQFPSNDAVFDPCSLIPNYQPSFGWDADWTFAQYTLLLSTSPSDFTTRGVLITKASVSGTSRSWMPAATLWKTIMTSSYNEGNIGDIYWKVIGTKADKRTVESEVRSFKVGDPQKVTLKAPSGGAILPANILPTFEFDANCNIKFRLEISSMADFSTPTQTKSFAYTLKDPNVETVVKRALTSFQWTSVKQRVGKGTGYFRIRGWDGINREIISETRSFTIEFP